MNFMSHDADRAELLREREARAAAYLAALAERDELAASANRPEADAYDKRALSIAETRLGRARWSCEFWGDPLPAATQIDSAAPGRAPAPQGLGAGAADTVEAVARRILEA